MPFALIFQYSRVDIEVKEGRSNLVLFLTGPMMMTLDFLGHYPFR
jgi:hypothetical protein